MKNKLNTGRRLFALAMIAVLTNAFAATAQADEGRGRDEWRDHERNAREWHYRHMHRHDQPVAIEQPNIVYAPPVIVEAPQLSSDTGSSGFNITIPINFR